MDEITDEVSDARESIISHIRNGHANHLFKTSKINEIIEKTLE